MVRKISYYSKKIFFIYLCCLPYLFAAQVSTDSLWQIWTNTHLRDTVRLIAIRKLGSEIERNMPDSAFKLAEKQLELAVFIKDKKWECKAFLSLGYSSDKLGNLEQALVFYNKCLVLQKELKDKKTIANVYQKMGVVYTQQGNFREALYYLRKSLVLSRELKNVKMESYSLSGIAIVYRGVNDFQKALDYFIMAESRISKSTDRNSLISKAIYCSDIGATYVDLKKFDQGLQYLKAGLKISTQINDVSGMILANHNIGGLFVYLKDYGKAREYFYNCLKIIKETGLTRNLAEVYIGIGASYMEQKKYSKAIDYCRKGFESSKEIKSIGAEWSACACLYNSYKGLNDSKNALLFYEQYNLLNDSLNKKETAVALEKMQITDRLIADSLKSEKRRLEAELNYHQAVNAANRSRNIIILIGLLVLIFALVLLLRLKYIRKSKSKIENEFNKLNLQVKYDSLKNKVNPHFLFNSLNSLSSLISSDSKKAEKFLEELASMYRYILRNNENGLTSLKDELDLIESYAHLLKTRHGDGFHVEFDIDKKYLDHSLPSLSLQLLLENTAKHNVVSKSRPLFVKIETTDNHTLKVSNNLQKKESRIISSKVGLNNIILKYELLNKGVVIILETDTEFIVEIPLIKAA